MGHTHDSDLTIKVPVGIRGRSVDLYVQLTDVEGKPRNADTTPLVEIIDSAGRVQQIATNLNVGLVDYHPRKDDVSGPDDFVNDHSRPGLYHLSYNIPVISPDGYWAAVWSAYLGGYAADAYVTSTFSFYVTSAGELTETERPEYYPGRDVPWHFNEDEVYGINVLLKMLRPRLKNNGYREVMVNGCYVKQPCSVFTDDELIAFMVNSLSTFNSTPTFTRFTFDDPVIHVIFADLIIQGAVLLALAAQTLIERGREFTLNDNGVTYVPPALAEILNTQYNEQLANYTAKLNKAKFNLKPHALGLGTFRITSVAPAFMRLRHLREHQII
jgi:hypothetical protein